MAKKPAEMSREELEDAVVALRELRELEGGGVPVGVGAPRPSSMTATKAWAAGGGGALGAALAEILILLLPQLAPAQSALSIVLAAIVGAFITYWAPANRPINH